ncbi:adenosylcobinamide-GDP ribazoletransferase [Halovivax gelatinilyticus]|uniref:adenosylcobinamide-GDP ribazoletransferase n=1 Tax=Halovivax gelatinilyticus TaxID=2961597 RepID=UPI0020CA9470|nr:adenosylcobinamide-GDP ribazoletransferase [Halovivax gelatinilyticus]
MTSGANEYGRKSRPVGALRAGFGFLTRLPTGDANEADWDAFRRSLWVFPAVGFVVGSLAAIPLAAVDAVPAVTVAFGYVVTIYLVTGIHHVDGVADLGDAVVVHGDGDRRRAVLKDTTTGVGALLAVSLVVVGLALGGLALTIVPIAVAATVVLAAEVGAKLSMAAIAAFATASHEGTGSQFTRSGTHRSLAAATLVSLSAVLLLPILAPIGTTGVAVVGLLTLGGSLAGGAVPWMWARARLGGVTGDVFGAANEIGRLVGIHLGVIAWTLS